MINFLHTHIPEPVLLSFGPFTIYKYGLLIALSILTLLTISLKIASYYKLEKEIVIDAVFYSAIFGILGARIYEVFLELPYYIANPTNIIKVWNGGLAIHGAIIGAFIFLYFFSKRKNLNLWKLLSIGAPGFALGQAIGRWGNYFNQELYGLPTTLPWGIPIEDSNKVIGYLTETHFHPTFLYESLGSLLIFSILLTIHFLKIKDKINIKHSSIFLLYISLYSILRFSLEFIKIDITPEFFGLRVPQIISLALISASTIFYFKIKKCFL